jgi:putative transposase
MSARRYSAEQIITKLREAEVLSSQGIAVVMICKKLGITPNTYYRRRKEYGGLEVDQAKKLKELERENARLKKLVAEQALDIDILKEASRGK